MAAVVGLQRTVRKRPSRTCQNRRRLRKGTLWTGTPRPPARRSPALPPQASASQRSHAHANIHLERPHQSTVRSNVQDLHALLHLPSQKPNCPPPVTAVAVSRTERASADAPKIFLQVLHIDGRPSRRTTPALPFLFRDELPLLRRVHAAI